MPHRNTFGGPAAWDNHSPPLTQRPECSSQAGRAKAEGAVVPLAILFLWFVAV
jgi:hypothetical protein